MLRFIPNSVWEGGPGWIASALLRSTLSVHSRDLVLPPGMSSTVTAVPTSSRLSSVPSPPSLPPSKSTVLPLSLSVPGLGPVGFLWRTRSVLPSKPHWSSDAHSSPPGSSLLSSDSCWPSSRETQSSRTQVSRLSASSELEGKSGFKWDHSNQRSRTASVWASSKPPRTPSLLWLWRAS